MKKILFVIGFSSLLLVFASCNNDPEPYYSDGYSSIPSSSSKKTTSSSTCPVIDYDDGSIWEGEPF